MFYGFSPYCRNIPSRATLDAVDQEGSRGVDDREVIVSPGEALPRTPGRPGHREPRAHPADHPFRHPLERELVEPDCTRLPGYRSVTGEQWRSAQWQRAH